MTTHLPDNQVFDRDSDQSPKVSTSLTEENGELFTKRSSDLFIQKRRHIPNKVHFNLFNISTHIL